MRWLLLALVFVSCRGAAHAAQRVTPSQYRDSLAQVTDTSQLRLAASTPAADVFGLVARGLAALRLYALTNHDADIDHARAAFSSATRLDRDNAWAWYGLGQAWSAHAARPAPKIVAGQAFTEALGLDAPSRALRAFVQALELDPEFTPAALAAVPLAILRQDRDALERARRVLAADEQAGRFELDALLALADAEASLGHTAAAASAAARAATLAAAGDGAAVLQYRVARALLVSGDDERGANEWFAAIDGLTPALEAGVFEDLRSIAHEREQEQWHAGDLRSRQQWLRSFWDVRAALAGLSVAERMGSHYRRLAEARDRFPRRRKWGAPPANALLLERPDLPFDDRGLIFVRHGEPHHVIRTANAFAPPSESWVYREPDGTHRVLHFDNYASGTRSLGAVGNAGAAGYGGTGDAYNEYVLIYNLPCDAEWAGDRAGYDRRLALLRCNEFDRRSISAEVRRDARLALRTDTDQPAFARDLPFIFDAFTFRGVNGLTDVTAALVLPAAAIDAAAGAAFELSVIVTDTVHTRVTRADTTFRAPLPSPVPGALLRLHATLAVPPAGAQALRVLLRDATDPAHGRLAGAPLDVADYSGTNLMVSDIVLAAPDTSGTFRRGDISLALAPTRAFPAAAFHVFYEIYNLSAAQSYETELVVERRQGGIAGTLRRLFGGRSIVRLRFLDRAPDASRSDSVVRELRRIDAALPPGQYRIDVRIHDPLTGQRVERARDFTVSASPVKSRKAARSNGVTAPWPVIATNGASR